MMGNKATALGVLAAAMLTAHPATAAIYTVTFEGTVTSGVDLSQTFRPGLPRGGYAFDGSQTFKAVFTIDDTTPGAFDFTSGAWQPVSTIFGSGAANPIVSASLTINGVTADMSAPFPVPYDVGQFQITGSPYLNAFTESEGDGGGGAYIVRRLNITARAAGGIFQNPDWRRITALDTAALDTGRGYFHLHNMAGPISTDFAYGELLPTRVTFTGPSPIPGGVPEPGAWSLMILGFATVGAAVRRGRRRQGSTASASISTRAFGSTSPLTATSVIAGKCRPRVSPHAAPTSAPPALNSAMSVT